MKYAYLTSLSKEYYDKIGHAMISSWKKFQKSESILYVFSEDDMTFLNCNNIKFIDWNVHCLKEWEEFSKTANHEYEIFFAKKGFTCINGWKIIDADNIIWVDSDLVFLDYISDEIMDTILPKEKLIALFNHSYLGDRYKGFSSESGFFILNKLHKEFKNFTNEYERVYKLDYTPSEIVGREDNKILMYVASRFIDDVVDMSEFRNKQKTTTPLNHSWLSKYMTHYKGNVKYNPGFKI